MTCPKCEKGTAHRSHRSRLDWVISWVGYKPYRCKNCQHRFYAFRSGEHSPKLRTPEERRIMQLRRKIQWRHTRAAIILYSLGSLVFLALLYYLIQQRIVSE